MNKKAVVIGVVLAAVVVAGVLLWRHPGKSDDGTLVLNGNVDIRQVSLAFNGSGRISALAVEEGDYVKEGQVLGHLDDQALRLQAEEIKAQIEVQRQNLERLQSGARVQEIAQAQSRVKAAEARAVQACNEWARLQKVAADTAGQGTSAQEMDVARSNAKVAQVQVNEQRDALKLLHAGSRKEDIAAAQAQLNAAQAQLNILQYKIDQSVLSAPTDGVIRSRLLEPGDMATPQQAVFTLALTRPKWVRAYVAESDLGKIKPGMRAQVTTDSAPNQPLAAMVGYISSVAEFTPKSVQTTDLRTSLVYEIRVMVPDEHNALRMGQPATVRLNLHPAAKP